MKINEIHKDIDRYLKNDCYCQNEVYDLTGYFYMIVNQEDETSIIDQVDDIILSAWKDQVLVIHVKNDMVININRVDATENNIKNLKILIHDRDHKFNLDEHIPGSTQKSLKEIIDIADAIMID